MGLGRSLFFSVFAAVSLLFVPVLSYAQDAGDTFALARVESITDERVENVMDMERTVQKAVLRISSGYEEGKTIEIDNGVLSGREDLRLAVGETVVVEKLEKVDGSVGYAIRDKYRIPSLLLLTLFFVVLTIAFGGRTGVSSFAGLLVSVALLAFVVLPAITRGSDPLLTSFGGALLIACTSLFLAHGFSRRTSVAFLSTVITLLLSVVLAIVFVHVAKLFGMGSEESMFLQAGPFQDLNLRGLLLGGIIIGALGVLDDITTAQTAAIHEISRANPRMTSGELRRAGTSIGREHIASLINTLALAYVGTSLPLLLMFSINVDFPLWVTLNSEYMAEEIIRTLVGSSTLLLAVPISTWLAAALLRNAPAPAHGGHSHVHHHA